MDIVGGAGGGVDFPPAGDAKGAVAREGVQEGCGVVLEVDHGRSRLPRDGTGPAVFATGHGHLRGRYFTCGVCRGVSEGLRWLSPSSFYIVLYRVMVTALHAITMNTPLT